MPNPIRSLGQLRKASVITERDKDDEPKKKAWFLFEQGAPYVSVAGESLTFSGSLLGFRGFIENDPPNYYLKESTITINKTGDSNYYATKVNDPEESGSEDPTGETSGSYFQTGKTRTITTEVYTGSGGGSTTTTTTTTTIDPETGDSDTETSTETDENPIPEFDGLDVRKISSYSIFPPTSNESVSETQRSYSNATNYEGATEEIEISRTSRLYVNYNNIPSRVWIPEDSQSQTLSGASGSNSSSGTTTLSVPDTEEAAIARSEHPEGEEGTAIVSDYPYRTGRTINRTQASVAFLCRYLYPGHRYVIQYDIEEKKYKDPAEAADEAAQKEDMTSEESAAYDAEIAERDAEAGIGVWKVLRSEKKTFTAPKREEDEDGNWSYLVEHIEGGSEEEEEDEDGNTTTKIRANIELPFQEGRAYSVGNVVIYPEYARILDVPEPEEEED